MLLLVLNFEFTKTPRESLLTVNDCCRLLHPTPAHTPLSGACVSISWTVVACGELSTHSCMRVKCKLSVGWGLLLVSIHFCLPNFDQFRPLQHLTVEVWTAVENLWAANLEKITSCIVDETPSWYVRSLLRHETAEGPNAACQNSGEISVPKKHLEIIHPETRGWEVEKILRGLNTCTRTYK